MGGLRCSRFVAVRTYNMMVRTGLFVLQRTLDIRVILHTKKDDSYRAISSL